MKVLIAYYSASGKTAQMAEYIAEGVRFAGHEVAVKKIEDIKEAAELAGYRGCIIGSPTFSLDIPEPVKMFLSRAAKANLEGKMGGSFGAYRHDVGYKHDTYAPAIIFDILRDKHKMKPFELGPFNLQEEAVETREGMKACQDYGRVFGEKLGG